MRTATERDLAIAWLKLAFFLWKKFSFYFFFEKSFSTLSLERKGGAQSSSEFDADLLCVRTFVLTNSRLGKSFRSIS
jgi:hypothetical protein